MGSMQTVNRRIAAFTLIELLVVMAIVALLAAMLLPSLRTAKQSARIARCKANVRQLSLALHFYVDDTGYYPRQFERRREGTRAWIDQWPELLAPRLASSWTGEVFRCPDYPGPTAPDPKINMRSFPVGSYGYNCDMNNRSLERDPPVREVEVKAPSEMVGLGDGTLVSLQSPLSWGRYQIIGYGVLSKTFASGPFSFVDPVQTRAATRRRHRDHYNVAFCDGHIESIKHDALFSDTDAARRRWHRDNEP
jgi:prepilin-type N-terminal cleavage/methylation domain-containing protein/prepilin-type processing-associated H-X9-DG protein